jgi:hypothetical protein
LIYGFSPSPASQSLNYSMSLCLDSIILWCSSNRLDLNIEKSEVMWCSSRQKRQSFSSSSVRFGDANLCPKSSVKWLGCHVDSEVSFSTHVSKTVSTCFGILRQIRSVRRSLTEPLLLNLVKALVFPHLDYCSSMLTGIQAYQKRRLQTVIHASARLVCGVSRFSHITPFLRELKWLPIQARIEYRLCMLVYKCRRGLAPAYLIDELTFASSASGRSRLRSAHSAALCVPLVKRPTIGGRAFRASAVKVWNTLPQDLATEECFPSFKRRLKSFLLCKHFSF